MRNRLGLGVVGIAVALAMGACTVESTDTDAQPGGAGGSSGSAGSSGASGSSGAGQCIPEAPGPECGDVPQTGQCICGNRIQTCVSAPATSNDQDNSAILKTVGCDQFSTCQINAKGVAECVDSRSCRPGDSECDGNTLKTCKADGSGFDTMDCGQTADCTTPPGQQAQCVSKFASSGGQKHTLSGRIRYETKDMTKDQGVTQPIVGDAFLQFIAVYNGDKYIGSAITKFDGTWEAELNEPATADTTVYIYALDFKPNSKQPLIGVVRGDASANSIQVSDDYWFWSNKGDSACGMQAAKVNVDANGTGVHTMDELTIPISCGSGAIRIFQWIRFSLLLTGSDQYGVDVTKGKPQDSVAVFWEPGKEAFCGACFGGRQFGGAVVKPKGTTTEDKFDTMMYISGSNDNPTHWANAVLGHEAGHWQMANYSKSPGEGGKHYVTQASKPGLAYSEGFATAVAQWTLSDPGNGKYDPLYIDTQGGTTFWVDIEKATKDDTTDLAKPDPNGPIDQFINENIVAGMIWHMWHPPAAGSGPYQNMGESKIWAAVQDQRLTNEVHNRGYKKFDTIDFLDATICTKGASEANVSAVSTHFSFPWDSKPQCP